MLFLFFLFYKVCVGRWINGIFTSNRSSLYGKLGQTLLGRREMFTGPFPRSPSTINQLIATFMPFCIIYQQRFIKEPLLQSVSAYALFYRREPMLLMSPTRIDRRDHVIRPAVVTYCMLA